MAGVARWGYAGDVGPEHWGGLEAAFSQCALGKNQSPIDLGHDTGQSETTVRFDYRPAPLEIVKTDYSIQLNCPSGGFLHIDSLAYALQQIHFHCPSEHTIRGRTCPMEAHLVHLGQGGEMAVVGIFLTEGPACPLLETLRDYAPGKAHAPTAHADVTVDASELLPASSSYYLYEGSLTTPPCTEGVRWVVLERPVAVSSNQIRQFVDLFGPTARPVQPLNGREVLRGGINR